MLTQAWIDTRMEIDRTLVSLAAGGVALLVGLLAAAEVPADLRTYGAALTAFVLAIAAGIVVFHLNARLLRASITDLSAAEKSWTKHLLTALSWALILLFAAGTLLSVRVGHDTARVRRASDSTTTPGAQHEGQGSPTDRHQDQAAARPD